MKRSLSLVAGVAGAAVLAGLIIHAGPARLAAHLQALGPVLPLLLALTGARYVLQAAGWRLAIAPANLSAGADRPGWAPFVNAVIVGEAVGYVAWGPIAREPAKALFLRPLVPARVALTAAIVERAIFVVTATVLAVVAAGLLAMRRGLLIWLAAAAAVTVALAVIGRLRRTTRTSRPDRPASTGTLEVARHLWHHRPAALLGIGGLAVAQETINVLETYVIFTWLGAAPTVTAALVFEGLSRFVNAAGQFVPGRIGVYEAASAFLADALSLGASHGVSLALARRARSLLWALPGALLLAHRGYQGAARAAGRGNLVPAPLEVRP
ncbi:MAG: flippase-like domain-containing protein [Acidobacteria bacterium]|nr:flippase-like domain-containing protein [Acidobacteriota bacterium]